MKIRRLVFLALGLTLVLPWAGSMGTDGGGELYIGISKIVDHPALNAIEQGIQDSLEKAGYQARYNFQNANGDASTAAQIASIFKQEKVTFAVGIATPTAQALANLITDIPVVFSGVTDPVGAGLVPSLTGGGGNVTGFSDLIPVEEHIKILSQIVDLKILGHVYNNSEDNAVSLANMTKAACQKLGIEFVEATVSNSSEVRSATQSIVDRVDAIYVTTDNTVIAALESLSSVAYPAKVPVFSADPTSMNDQVLISSGFDYYAIGLATGDMIIEIINGKKPSEIPVGFLTKPEEMDLILNQDAADALGLTFPQNLIDAADKIIKTDN